MDNICITIPNKMHNTTVINHTFNYPVNAPIFVHKTSLPDERFEYPPQDSDEVCRMYQI